MSTTTIYLVIHDKLPTYSMYLHNRPYSEPIETVNSNVVSAHSTYKAAKKAAGHHFFQNLEYQDSGKSENGGYHYSPPDGDCGTWDEEVYVRSCRLEDDY